jgi:hypothetical protein
MQWVCRPNLSLRSKLGPKEVTVCYKETQAQKKCVRESPGVFVDWSALTIENLVKQVLINVDMLCSFQPGDFVHLTNIRAKLQRNTEQNRAVYRVSPLM